MEDLLVSVSTSCTNHRVKIFRHDIPSILNDSELSPEHVSILIEIIFKTLIIYDDRQSRKAVDDVIARQLSNLTFAEAFNGALVKAMEKQLTFQTHFGCYRLLEWSCLVFSKSHYASVSKKAVCQVAPLQANIVHILMQRSYRERKAVKHLFFHLFSQYPDIRKMYIEELKDARIPYKDSPELMSLILEISSASSSNFEVCKPMFIDIYVKAVLNAREKPSKELSEAFYPLFPQMSHEDLQNILIPSSVKILKSNPEIAVESVGILFKSVDLDFSKYAIELLPVVLTQARHTDQGRRSGALTIIRYLSQKSSNPDAVEAMFSAVKAIIRDPEGRLQFPYQRIGMFDALYELSNAPDGKYFSRLSQAICCFLLSCYKDEGNQEVKLAILSAVACWAARSVDAVQPDVISFLASGLEEKEVLRRGHLRCLRSLCKNSDAILLISSLLGPLVQLVKTGFTKAEQRLDGVYALLVVGKIAATDFKAEETLSREKIWSLISQNEPSLVQISVAAKWSVEDCMACIDLLEVLLLEHSHRVLEAFSVKLLLQLVVFFLCHPNWDVRKKAQDATRKIIASVQQTSEAILLEYLNYLSLIHEKSCSSRMRYTDALVDARAPLSPSVEVLVKALFVISSATLSKDVSSALLAILCAHHPCIVGTAKQDTVWRRLHKCLRTHGHDVIGIITDSANAAEFCKGLLGQLGLMSLNACERQAAINALSTLMSIIPKETFGVRSVAALATGSLIRGIGEDNFLDLVPWLFDTLKSDNSNVELSGAAQGLSEQTHQASDSSTKCHPYKSLFTVYLLRAACSSKPELKYSLPDICNELHEFNLLSEQEDHLGRQSSLEFSANFAKAFDQEKETSLKPAFWKLIDENEVPSPISSRTGGTSGTDEKFIGSRYSKEFRELERIDAGSFGSTFKCQNRLDGQTYAVKKIRFEDEDEEVTLREAQILASVRHKHIVQYFQAWVEHEDAAICSNASMASRFTGGSSGSGSCLYIQMEYCKRTLRDVLKVNHMDKQYGLHIFKQIILGVDYMHRRGIIHRDLKPANILLDDQNQVKIGDFGFAADLNHGVVRNLDRVDGTEFYRAPEISLTDEKADVHSLGVILFELLYPLGKNQSKEDILEELLDDRPPASWSQEFPAESSLVRRMISQDKFIRPSIQEVLKVISETI